MPHRNARHSRRRSRNRDTERRKTLQTIRVEATAEATSTAAKLPLSLRETPQSVTVVTRERLDDQNLQSLQDVLDNTPGIYTYAWDTERVIFTSRGFVIDNLMYDGVPAETNFSTDSIDETIDTAMYERIEIVRGATGLMTGAGSPAASDQSASQACGQQGVCDSSLGLTAGSWNDYRVDADVSTPLNQRRQRARPFRRRVPGHRILPGSVQQGKDGVLRHRRCRPLREHEALRRRRLPGKQTAVQHLGLFPAVPR